MNDSVLQKINHEIRFEKIGEMFVTPSKLVGTFVVAAICIFLLHCAEEDSD